MQSAHFLEKVVIANGALEPAHSSPVSRTLPRKAPKRVGIVFSSLAIALTVGAGCRNSPPPNTAANPAPNATSIPEKRSASQQLGIDIVREFAGHSVLKTSQISVGVSGTTITLNGNVKNKAHIKLAQDIVRKKVPRYRIMTDLKVVGSTTTPQRQLTKSNKPAQSKP